MKTQVRPLTSPAAATSRLRLRVHYPAGDYQLCLRTDQDWDRDISETPRGSNGVEHNFEIECDASFHYAKPVLRRGEELRWAQGENLLLLPERGVREVYPHFDGADLCHVCTLHHPPAAAAEQGHAVRVWVPDGYDENPLARYPVLYMQDGQNLFLSEEAYGGESWRVGETMKLLRAMNLTRPTIVVGIYPRDRMQDYTPAGNDAYLRFCLEDLKPWVDENYRSLPGARHTAVMGSSLGGLVSLHLALSRPDVFGKAACLSSTFGMDDQIFARVQKAPKRPVEIYLDSGWPHDNYEVTRSMRCLLVQKGWREGLDLHYYAFPEALHNEQHWAMRAHLPFQILFGERSQLGASVETREAGLSDRS